VSFGSFRNAAPYAARFHEDIKKSLERRRADVVELSQNLSEPMQDIHNAIIQCMTATLSELKRSNTTVCLRLDTSSVQYQPDYYIAGPGRSQRRKRVLSLV
jgi:hypothetical protein